MCQVASGRVREGWLGHNPQSKVPACLSSERAGPGLPAGGVADVVSGFRLMLDTQSLVRMWRPDGSLS